MSALASTPLFKVLTKSVFGFDRLSEVSQRFVKPMQSEPTTPLHDRHTRSATVTQLSCKMVHSPHLRNRSYPTLKYLLYSPTARLHRDLLDFLSLVLFEFDLGLNSLLWQYSRPDPLFRLGLVAGTHQTDTAW